MNDIRSQLLAWIDADRDQIVEFFSAFVAAKSPNPPGDTRLAARHVTDFLTTHDLPHQVVDPHPEMPNVIGSFDGGGGSGRHLVLNGHLDCFPVKDGEVWQHDPWSGEIADGKVWGRGAADMKAGATSIIYTYAYLHRIKEHLNGRLSLTAVSDEETFGPYGARHLIKEMPELHGDCCLSGEPSSPYTIRFGEKGPLWLRFTVTTPGGHSAYPHLSASATKIAVALAADLIALEERQIAAPDLGPIYEAGKHELNRAQGQGAAEVVDRMSVNIGRIEGGLKVNMIPSECQFDLDIRLPLGLERSTLLSWVDEIAGRYPEAGYEEVNFSAPNWCDPDGEMVRLLQRNAHAVCGVDPKPVVGLGATDTRLWRYLDIPAYIYGPSAIGMGSVDEYVEIEEFINILKTHVLTAYDYLTAA